MHEKISSCALHGPAPIPQEGGWTKFLEIADLSGLNHGIGACVALAVRTAQANGHR
ncbi:hypothetical protein [Desulfosporosinus sp. SB140]|uniref:hypothetical protein n=1 Tax=Desulfosporosinus paludis TaxID=3115649 RepID=UPI00388D4C4E